MEMESIEMINRPIDEECYEIWDNSKRAKNLITVFWILLGLTLISLLFNYLQLDLLHLIDEDLFYSQDEIDQSDMRQAVIGILVFVTYIMSVVFFLNWFRRAYGNLHRLKTGKLEHTETMAVWSWFIPLISLFRPVQIMSEIWKKTQIMIKRIDSTYHIQDGGLAIGAWWFLFIISNIIGRYILKTAFKTDTVQQIIEGTEAQILSDLFQIPEALLVIYIVTKLSAIETKMAAEISRTGGTIVYK